MPYDVEFYADMHEELMLLWNETNEEDAWEGEEYIQAEDIDLPF